VGVGDELGRGVGIEVDVGTGGVRAALGGVVRDSALGEEVVAKVVPSMSCWADDAVLWLTNNASPSSGGHQPARRLGDG